MRKWLQQIYYSFPLQLLKLHLRSNLLLLALWVLLVLLLTGSIGPKYGINYLFLSPEYMGAVDFWSFFFVGLTYGEMVMSWNLTTYLISAYHFPFLATLERPFTKFCLNNFIIPTAFAALMLVAHSHFEIYFEFRTWQDVFMNILGFFFGMSTLVIVLFVYFSFTNKDIKSFAKIREQLPPDMVARLGPGQRLGRGPASNSIFEVQDAWRVDTYLTESLRPRIVRSVAHYDSSMLVRIFRQNHINALLVQIFSLLLLVMLGYLIDQPSFRIPAVASMFLLGSIFMALTGAISYWFHRWRWTMIVVLLAVVNMVTKYEVFNHKNVAYGLNYETAPATYSYEALEAICSPENVAADKAATIEILEKWKAKMRAAGTPKPKMILYAVSGGGLKSAVWSMQVLRHADSLTNGKFWDQTVLFSGASGGIIGTAYYRE
ncbi:MAG: hypothetical protein KDC44_18965 [Phaeodactylibacter sp.]|nr:hypothetical protein [Phaeodactylibacter sp.]